MGVEKIALKSLEQFFGSREISSLLLKQSAAYTFGILQTVCLRNLRDKKRDKSAKDK